MTITPQTLAFQPRPQPVRGVSRRGFLKSGLDLAGIGDLAAGGTTAYAAGEAAFDFRITDYLRFRRTGRLPSGSPSASSPIFTPATRIWASITPVKPQVPDRVALTLAGHTHSGQVRVPILWPRWVPAYGARFAYGHIVETGRHMIVSGGIGTSFVSLRLGMPPEIVRVQLGA
jgi:hypothetical protein